MSRLVTKKGGMFGVAAVLVATATGTLALNTVKPEEGVRLRTYKDIVGVNTYCYGETKDAKPGQTYTLAQCDKLLLARLDEFANHVEACIHKPMSDKTEVAFVSFSYNIGVSGFCNSTTARRYNAGDYTGACQAMMLWTRAGEYGDVLEARRGREMKMCLEGLK